MQGLLHLQRGNFTRYVQPFIYDWPDKGSIYPATEFPYLNWYGDTAGHVADEVLRQFRRMNIKVQTNKDAVRLTIGSPHAIEFADGTVITADVVIFTVGFGLERLAKGQTALMSYWRNDALSQPTVGRNARAEILVSGTGDGGLIEALRLKLKDFDHWKFIETYFNNSEYEDAAKTAKVAFDANPTDPNVWSRIAVPEKVLRAMQKNLRDDTDVVLNYSSTVFGEDASLFNKLAVAILCKLGALRFERGRLLKVKPTPGKQKVVLERMALPINFRNPLTKRRVEWRLTLSTKKLDVDQVVVRHGAEAALDKLLDPVIAEAVRARWKPIVDVSHQRHYDGTYLFDEFMPYKKELKYRVTFWRESMEELWPIILRLSSLMRFRGVFFPAGPEPVHQSWQQHRLRAHVRTATVQFQPSGIVCSELTFETRSRRLLEIVLASDEDPYQRFEIEVYRDATEPNWEPITLPGPYITITQRRTPKTRYLVAHCSMPFNPVCMMLQAHRLLSADVMLEILRHEWTVKRMIDMGWRITAPLSANHNWSYLAYHGR